MNCINDHKIITRAFWCNFQSLYKLNGREILRIDLDRFFPESHIFPKFSRMSNLCIPFINLTNNNGSSPSVFFLNYVYLYTCVTISSRMLIFVQASDLWRKYIIAHIICIIGIRWSANFKQSFGDG